jgi:hypothetical protein
MARRIVLERELSLALDRQLGAEAQAARLAEFSKQRLQEAIASGEGSPHFETFVNGRRGREETVIPPGPIVYEFNWWPDLLIYGIQFLRNRVPLHSGRRAGGMLHYRDRFFVLANETSVNPRQYKTIPTDAEVLIGNSAPYSRKLDVQLIGREKINVSVPPDFFEAAAVAIRARYGNLVTVKRLYTIHFTGQYEILRGRDAGTPVHSPALQILPRGR